MHWMLEKFDPLPTASKPISTKVYKCVTNEMLKPSYYDPTFKPMPETKVSLTVNFISALKISRVGLNKQHNGNILKVYEY